MNAEIELLTQILNKFLSGSRMLEYVDRPQVLAHALLSALHQHWPSRTTVETAKLLEQTMIIRETEWYRWIV